MQASVYLLDVNYMYIGTVSWKRAVRLMNRSECVEVVHSTGIEIRRGFFLPLVLRLLKMVRKFYGKEVRFNRHRMLVRDGYACQYCGMKKVARELTVEHILPESKGGKTTWENCVSACRPCNNRKGNKTPREAGMFPRKQPTAPTIMEHFRREMETCGAAKVLKSLGLI